MAAYKPLFLVHLNILPFDVGRLTLQDYYMCRSLADEFEKAVKRGR